MSHTKTQCLECASLASAKGKPSPLLGLKSLTKKLGRRRKRRRGNMTVDIKIQLFCKNFYYLSRTSSLHARPRDMPHLFLILISLNQNTRTLTIQCFGMLAQCKHICTFRYKITQFTFKCMQVKSCYTNVLPKVFVDF